MIKLKDFVRLMQKDCRLNLYIDNDMSLSCDMDSAIKLFKYDNRGELVVPEGSVSFHEYYNGVAGKHVRDIIVKCNTCN